MTKAKRAAPRPAAATSGLTGPRRRAQYETMTPRLFIDAPLEAGAAAPLSAEQAHYLKNVLRREAGAAVLVFNGRDGEFAGEIVELKKKGGLAALGAQTRAQEAGPDLELMFAPVKRGPLETIIQKATEIGVAALCPVITARTSAPKLNAERLQAIAIEAAEQCERLDVPGVSPPQKLGAALAAMAPARTLIFCDEAGDDPAATWGGRSGRAAPMLDALKAPDSFPDGTTILIGPEGGFAPEEREMLRARANVLPVTLGPRILRADTAAIAALVLWQAACGDWRRS